jgi:hypothetical protein
VKCISYFTGQAIHLRWKEGLQYPFGYLAAGDWVFFVSSGNKEYKYPVNPVDPVKKKNKTNQIIQLRALSYEL